MNYFENLVNDMRRSQQRFQEDKTQFNYYQKIQLESKVDKYIEDKLIDESWNLMRIRQKQFNQKEE